MKKIPSALVRAARCGLRLQQRQIAERAEIATPTIQLIEAGTANPKRSTMSLIRRAFEEMGVVFEDMPDGRLAVIFDPSNPVVREAIEPARAAPVKKAAPAKKSQAAAAPRARAKAK